MGIIIMRVGLLLAAVAALGIEAEVERPVMMDDMEDDEIIQLAKKVAKWKHFKGWLAKAAAKVKNTTKAAANDLVTYGKTLDSDVNKKAKAIQ